MKVNYGIFGDRDREAPWKIRQSCGVSNKQTIDNKRAHGLTLDKEERKHKLIIVGILISC